jgi:hypothetical protein
MNERQFKYFGINLLSSGDIVRLCLTDLAIGVADNHSAAGASAVLSHQPADVERGRMFNPLASATRTEDGNYVHIACPADTDGAEMNLNQDVHVSFSLRK